MITKIVKTFLLNNVFRWLLFLTVMTLNFIAFFQDPIRMSDSKCFGLSCRWFSFLAGMGTFFLDILTFIGLWLTIPFTGALPDLWFIPLIFIGFAIIVQGTIDSKIYFRYDAQGNETFNPPPNYLWSKRRRIILYTAILIIDMIIFIQFYIQSGITSSSTNTVQTGLHYLILDRFGSYDKNKIAFIVSWLGIGGFIADNIALSYVKNYEACAYDHPVSWNY